jgi:hypothetical protein
MATEKYHASALSAFTYSLKKFRQVPMHQNHASWARATCLFVTVLMLAFSGAGSEIIQSISKRNALGIEACHARLQCTGNGGGW